jgi:hypothetical protein
MDDHGDIQGPRNVSDGVICIGLRHGRPKVAPKKALDRYSEQRHAPFVNGA